MDVMLFGVIQMLRDHEWRTGSRMAYHEHIGVHGR